MSAAVAAPFVTDCHHHIYDSRYPSDPAARLRPPDASVEDYRWLKARLGIARHVIVQPSTYGTDNRLLVASLQQCWPEARGIAVVGSDVPEQTLAELAQAGVRGARLNFLESQRILPSMVSELAARIAPLGWHLQVHVTGDMILELKGVLHKLPVPVVIDHMGRIPQPAGMAHPAFAILLDLLQSGRAWTKLSGFDFAAEPPKLRGLQAMVTALVEQIPERLVWGTNWPHPSAAQKPDDLEIFKRFQTWIGDMRTQNRILDKNAAELYRFDQTA